MLETFHRPQINKTKLLPRPNYYTLALDGEFAHSAFSEERAPAHKGKWREVFGASQDAPLDLEIGTGNGTFFQHHCLKNPNRKVLGIELKYKPLIQTIRGAYRLGATNGKVIRHHAFCIDELFAANELDNVYLHFPDPWVAPRKPKNRFIQPRTLDLLFDMQKENSFFDFKTDSREYFLWAMESIRQSKYKIVFETLNLHQSEMNEQNFRTQFEKIFTRQGIEINFVRLQKCQK
jgi:tRNA (guanine-N7-)-methyltransferase